MACDVFVTFVTVTKNGPYHEFWCEDFWLDKGTFFEYWSHQLPFMHGEFTLDSTHCFIVAWKTKFFSHHHHFHSLQATLAQRFRNKYEETLQHQVMVHFVGAAPGSGNLLAVLRRLCQQLKNTFGLNLNVPQDFK